MKRKIYSFILLFVCNIAFVAYGSDATVVDPTIEGETSFAIVVDHTTYDTINDAVYAYRASVEQDGLPSYIVINDWKNPGIIRDILIELAGKQPELEGAVFIGDIPVPMIRDAQHLTTAFKLDQARDWTRSSVPSDRFYDDFDLEFTYISQDTSNRLLHYYSLDAGSPQRIERDIYSARIVPPVSDETRYKRIEEYLYKVVDEKSKQHDLQDVLTYSGHGYHSEALSAWEGMLIFLNEQFPQVYGPDGTIKNYYHTRGGSLKATLLRELQNPALDMAIFHAHGGNEAQYLMGQERARSVDQYVEQIKRFLRTRLRRTQGDEASIAEVKRSYEERFGIPEEWFEGAFVDSVITEDSLVSAQRDIYADDIKMISPQPRFMIFDQCFNGNFTADNYIAGKYVFSDGRTLAGVGNSVNVLQDVWSYELTGLISHGVRLGVWHQRHNTLETHLFGDPTFRYDSNGDIDLNAKLTQNHQDISFWRDLIDHDIPVLRALAVHKLFNHFGDEFEKELVSVYENDISATVRMQALKYLAVLRSPAFEEIVKKSISDPHELIRRKSAYWMGEIGKEEYIPYLVEARITDVSERVSYNARYSLDKINPELAYKAAVEYINTLAYTGDIDDLEMRHVNIYRNSLEQWDENLFSVIVDEAADTGSRIRALRRFRLYNYQKAIPSIITVARNSETDAEVRVTAFEVMGWYTFSHNRDKLIEICDEVLNQPDVPQSVADEALKTLNRLKTGPNNPMSP